MYVCVNALFCQAIDAYRALGHVCPTAIAELGLHGRMAAGLLRSMCRPSDDAERRHPLHLPYTGWPALGQPKTWREWPCGCPEMCEVRLAQVVVCRTLRIAVERQDVRACGEFLAGGGLDAAMRLILKPIHAEIPPPNVRVAGEEERALLRRT